MVFHYHKPLTGMYGDNYRYGTSLYSSTANDAEKKYRSSLSKTHVRSDRGDLGMYTFAGSNVHGGTPAAEKVTGVKGTRPLNTNLYSPINSGEYGRGYYDHLRATSPPPRTRSKATDLYEPIDPTEYHPGYYDHLRATSPDRKPRVRLNPTPYYDLPETDYMTNPSKLAPDYDYDNTRTTSNVSYDYDTGKKTTVKKTTTTDYWVPLTTYIYNTPYHTYYYKSTPFSSYTYRTADDLYSYNYVDDFKRYSTTSTTTKSKNIDALDLSMTSKSYEKAELSKYSEKCREIQSQLDEVNKWVKEAESKLKSDVVTCRSKIQSELAEVTMIVEDAARYSDDLHRAIKKQAKQISALNSQYDNINHHLVDISDVLEKSRSRCETLQSELSSVQTVLEVRTKGF